MQHLQTHISQAVNRQQVFQLSLVGSKVTHHLQGLIFKSLGPELTEPRWNPGAALAVTVRLYDAARRFAKSQRLHWVPHLGEHSAGPRRVFDRAGWDWDPHASPTRGRVHARAEWGNCTGGAWWVQRVARESNIRLAQSLQTSRGTKTPEMISNDFTVSRWQTFLYMIVDRWMLC